ncbi:4883_t:CDS:2 [Ambispora gerdemannii]|uniref:4883_t:CDS:1 n=1 Tax=Ambispora gerdemannii TaxID=144530 RepID=A0A9N8ZFU1_9GLOM|nr:4883_t:CDS:2 [Ambispora gerdemannii]
MERDEHKGDGEEEAYLSEEYVEVEEPERSGEYHGSNDGSRTSEDHPRIDGQQQQRIETTQIHDKKQSFDESRDNNQFKYNSRPENATANNNNSPINGIEQSNHHTGMVPVMANNSLLPSQSPSSQNIIMNNTMNIVQEHPDGPKISNQQEAQQYQQPSETKKLTLTPPLRSEHKDFLDMSDDDDDSGQNTKVNKFFGLGDSENKKQMPMEEILKDLPPEEDKQKGKKKKEGGILKKFFSKRKNVKKEENKSSLSNAAVSNVSTNMKTGHANSIEPSQQTRPAPQPQINKNPQSLTQGKQVRYPQPPQQTPSPQINQQQFQFPNNQPPTQGEIPLQSNHLYNMPPSNNNNPPQNISTSPEPIKDPRLPIAAMSTPTSPLTSVFRIYAGQNIQTNIESKTILLKNSTTTNDLIRQSLTRFKLDSQENWDDYYISVKPIHGEIINLMPNDHPLEIYNSFNTSPNTPLPTLRRTSTSSISSNASTVSNHQAIIALDINEYVQQSSIQFFFNKKLTQTKRNNRSSGEKRLRVHILIYADDLPPQLRKGISVPRTSMSVPKHLADKAARRRSHGEEGKPKEKILLVNGRATVGEVIEKALDKFGITDALVDDDKDIEDDDDGKLRYKLTLISEGEEKSLPPSSQVVSVFPSTPNFQHSSTDSIESASSLIAPDYNPDEPIFVLRQTNINDHQRYALPKVIVKPKSEQAKNHPTSANSRENNNQSSPSKSYEINDSIITTTTTTNSNITNKLPTKLEKIDEKALTRKQLIEQQREYSRAKQHSILSAQKNSEKGVDIVTRVGSIRSSRIFGSKIRYSFIPKQGEEIDISDIIEDIWGEELGEVQNNGMQAIPTLNFTPAEDDVPLIANVSVDPPRFSKKEKRLSTRNTDILEVIVENSNDKIVNQVMDDKIEQVLQKVKAGQLASGNASITLASHNQKFADSNLSDNSTREQSSIQNNNNITSKSIPQLISNPNNNESYLDSPSNSPSSYSPKTPPTPDGGFAQNLNSSPPIQQSSKNLNSQNTNTSQDALLPPHSGSSTASSAESDWVLSDDFGLQELLILVRSGVSMIEQKERRRSGWRLYDDPEKVLEQINPAEFREEIKSVFVNVNQELDDIENQLDLIMDDAVRVF